jgi:glycosyltransferase involved in cell wall biosynthesis
MKVSIITASYNSAKTIAGTMESVARQTHRDIEHIVVDGGSNDGTLQILAAHRAAIAKLISGPDKGIYDALNKGIDASSGDLIAFLHSDDVYADDDVLGQVVQEMTTHSLDALYGDIAFVREKEPARIIRVYSSRHFRPSTIAWGWMPAHPSLFLKRRLFQRFGMFKTDYAIAGDFEFVARVFRKPDFAYRYVPRVLVKMRTGGVSTGGWRSTLTLNREVLRACRENGIRSNYFMILSKYPVKLLEFFFR